MASGAQLNIPGNFYINGVLTNHGTVNWTAGDVRLWNDQTVFNEKDGTWNILCDNALNHWYSATFVNLGMLYKSGTSGTNAINVLLSNSGTVDAKNGSISFNLDAASTGTLQAEAGASLQFPSSTLSLDGIVNAAGAGTVLVNGATIGGTIQKGVLVCSAGAVGSGMTLTVANQAQLNFTGDFCINGLLTNHGTVNWTGGDIRLWTDQAVINETNGIWNILCDKALTHWYSPTFVNLGTINKSASSGTNTIDVIVNNTGSIHTLSGALYYNQGATILGTLLTDVGTSQLFAARTLTLDGVVNPTGKGTVWVTGASVQGTIRSGTLDCVECTIDSSTSLIVSNGARLNIDGNFYVNGVLTNHGTVNWTNGDVRLWIGQTIFNETNGTWSILCDRAFTHWYSSIFVNQGTMNKSATSGTNTVDVIMSNTGTIHTLSGALYYNQGATIQGTLLTDAGTAQLFAAQTLTLDGVVNPASAGTVWVIGGSVQGTIRSGTLECSDCSIDSATSLVVPSGALLNVIGNFYINGVLTNRGTVNWKKR